MFVLNIILSFMTAACFLKKQSNHIGLSTQYILGYAG